VNVPLELNASVDDVSRNARNSTRCQPKGEGNLGNMCNLFQINARENLNVSHMFELPFSPLVFFPVC